MGMVPDWITAFATVSAVVLAALAARAAGQQLAILRGEATTRSREWRMAQARLVYWDEGYVHRDEGAESEPRRYGFRLFNLSTEPLVTIDVYLTDPEREVAYHLDGLRPTGPEGTRIPAVEELMNDVSDRWFGRPLAADGTGVYGPHAFRIDLVFKDAGGRVWHRAWDMSLSEVEPRSQLHLAPLDAGQRGGLSPA
jgi:heme exporter protein D